MIDLNFSNFFRNAEFKRFEIDKEKVIQSNSNADLLWIIAAPAMKRANSSKEFNTISVTLLFYVTIMTEYQIRLGEIECHQHYNLSLSILQIDPKLWMVDFLEYGYQRFQKETAAQLNYTYLAGNSVPDSDPTLEEAAREIVRNYSSIIGSI